MHNRYEGAKSPESTTNGATDKSSQDATQKTVWTFAFGSNMCDTVLKGMRGVHPNRALVGRIKGYEFSVRPVPNHTNGVYE